MMGGYGQTEPPSPEEERGIIILLLLLIIIILLFGLMFVLDLRLDDPWLIEFVKKNEKSTIDEATWDVTKIKYVIFIILLKMIFHYLHLLGIV